ncbi:MAG: AURKAIP1/COX24 domain-containing protein [Dehalococcoidia bacterium]|nr:AURKAIP1/COX24 domain-containing protein [Dehalococcoidia bacterium]
MGSVLKWRRKKIRKHQHKKLLKQTRWQRRHG